MNSKKTDRRLITLTLIVLTSIMIGLGSGIFIGKLVFGLDENDYVAKSLLKELAIKYNVNTAFLRKIFPDDIIYLDNGQVTFTTYDAALIGNSYDWNNLIVTDDLYDYQINGQSVIWQGIDVSRFQGDIDWEAVAADGIDFAILRVGYRGYTEGLINQDDYFPQNASEATANGLDIGVYFFSQATTVDEAVEEAEFVLKTIEDYDITYPIIFDMEDISGADTRIDSLSSADVTAITIAFCEKIAVAGYTPMIYGNSHWFFAKLELDQVLEYDKWYAQYSTWPYYPYEFSIWQYSNTGTVAGIEGNVDRNISFVDYGAH